MNLKRGLSSLDIRNALVTNFSYELPVGKNIGGMGAKFIKGWQVNGILSLSSGEPLTILDPNAAQNTRIGSNELLTPNLIPGGKNDPVLGGPTHYYDTTQFTPSTLGFFGTVGRNTLTAPGFVNVDFSLFKEFPVTERSRLQFRAEFFNLFNHANFGIPVVTNFLSSGQPNPSAGVISDTGNHTSREIQFALKFIF
jgi:hypothetical protein